jgi:hypothetical protein
MNIYKQIFIIYHSDYSLVKLLREQLTIASKSLYDATGGITYLKKVHIVVPRTWDAPTQEKCKNCIKTVF